jgi:hypothetical protein
VKRDLETAIDIVSRITTIRAQRVLLDSALATLYGEASIGSIGQ